MYNDFEIFRYLNGLANLSSDLDNVGIFLADYLQYLLGVILLVLLFWPKKDIVKNRSMVLVAAVSAVFARLVLKTIILWFYPRPRPYVSLPSVHQLVGVSPSETLQSFPSGHTLFFFAISTAVYIYNKKLGILFYIASIAMGLARIFVGVHWPSDIIAGALFGIVTTLVVQKYYLKYKQKLKIPF